MKIRLIFPALMIFISAFLYADNITDLNDRAKDDIELNPSESIYYGDMALYENKESDESKIETNYILSRAYRRVKDHYKTQYYIEQALKLDEDENYIYNLELYYYAARVFLENEDFNKLKSLISNEKVISRLNEEGLIIFNIIKLYMDRAEGIELDFPTMDRSISLADSMGLNELEAELNLFYGESFFTTNPGKARSYFQRAIELSESDIKIKALIKEYEVTLRVEYLEKALLAGEEYNNVDLIISVLDLLKNEYIKTKSYKNLAIISEKQLYFNKIENKFLLKQYEALSNFSYMEDRLKLELEESNIRKSLLISLLGLSGALHLLLIIIILILNYRLRRRRG